MGGGLRLRVEQLEERTLLSFSGAVDYALLRPVGAFQGDATTQTAVFQFAFRDTPVLEQSDGGTIVRMAGEETIQTSGYPMVPFHAATVLLPDNTHVTSVEIAYGDPGLVIATGVDLKAAPAELLKDGTVIGTAEASGVFADSFGSSATFVNHGFRGYDLGTVHVYPVQYDAVARTLTYHASISVKVTAAPGGNDYLPIRDLQADRVDVARMVVNPEVVAAYSAPSSASGGMLSTSTLPPGGPYAYVIITPNALAGSFQKLIDEKKLGEGLTATIVTTEYIYDPAHGYTGTENHDDADKIRHFIWDACNNWETQWVLLGGDVTLSQGGDGVPARVTYVRNFIYVPCDLYFSSLTEQAPGQLSPWNGNGNDYWGETDDGPGSADVDLDPEISVGRAPVRDPAEADNFVAKTMKYAMHDELGHTTAPHFAPQAALWLGEHLVGQSAWAYDSLKPMRDKYVPAYWDVTERYDWPEIGPAWTRERVLSDLSHSPNIVVHNGHGNQTLNAAITTEYAGTIVNTYPYFIYSQACLSGDFTYAGQSVGEAELASKYGPFAAIMNSQLSEHSQVFGRSSGEM